MTRKKQLRISRPDEIRRRAGEFVQSTIDVVLNDHTPVRGVLVQVLPDTLVLKNMRLKKINIPIADISEFFADLDA